MKQRKQRDKVYAYVTRENCIMIRAVEPGTEVDGKPVSQHGDYFPWRRGKQATIHGARNNPRTYDRRAAQQVCHLFGWFWVD